MKTQAPPRFFRAIAPGCDFPSLPRSEIVFCGRSNVGKSSLLNALTGVKGLARTSKTPGRTREIHFYEQGHDRFLVDLPGYGYAKVSIGERRAWAGLVESYLARAERIALAVLLVDARHPPFETDLMLAASLEARMIPHLVALTKADRASMSEKSGAVGRARSEFPAAVEILLTSSKTGSGMKDLARRIEQALAGHGRGAQDERDARDERDPRDGRGADTTLRASQELGIINGLEVKFGKADHKEDL